MIDELREDNPGATRAWYQQFWPWFLILLPASVVVAGLTTLYIANRYSDDLVVEDYYREGLAINRQLEKKRRAADLGISVSPVFNQHSVAVQVIGPLEPTELFLLLSHPLESDRDFWVQLSQIEPGYYAAVIPHPVAPRWHWTIEQRAEPGWRLDGTVDSDNLGSPGEN
ncbi:MAG: FixH family protein [Halieaceae bacterium]|nr:FixH family protein [Halieaceae bacterium]